MRQENRQGGATRMAPKASPDFYQTPEAATECLLRVEGFDNPIWEPACGEGAISKVLEAHGHKVKSTDLNNYGFGESGVDFLGIFAGEVFQAKCPYQSIITNPPYNLVDQFILRGLELTGRKLALLLRVGHLEGQRRYRDIFKNHPPARVYVFPNRLKFFNERKGDIDSFKYPHAWFVWDKEFEKEITKLYWIDPDLYHGFERKYLDAAE